MKCPYCGWDCEDEYKMIEYHFMTYHATEFVDDIIEMIKEKYEKEND